MQNDAKPNDKHHDNGAQESVVRNYVIEVRKLSRTETTYFCSTGT
jgi:hypothetical protein